MKLHLSLPLALVACAAVLTACSDVGTVCTEIGCSDQIELHFVDEEGDPVDTFEGEAVFDDETIEFDCDQNGSGDGFWCTDDSVVLHHSPDEIEVTATSGTLSTLKTLEPEYEEVQPNGPDCPPTCHQTTETVTLYDAGSPM